MAKRKDHPLVGTVIQAVSRMPADELSMRGWDGSPAVITLTGRPNELYRLFPVKDMEGNGAGVVFGDSPKAAFYVFGSVDDQKMLQGRGVHEVRPMTKEELDRQGWTIHPEDSAPMVIVLRGMILYPSRDAAGNGPGFWRVDSPDGEENL